jgi:hypothetical protein
LQHDGVFLLANVPPWLAAAKIKHSAGVAVETCPRQLKPLVAAKRRSAH